LPCGARRRNTHGSSNSASIYTDLTNLTSRKDTYSDDDYVGTDTPIIAERRGS
jgi:hypothetical protein